MAGDKSIKWRPVQIGAFVEAKQMLPPICKTLVDIILATTVQPFIITDNEKKYALERIQIWLLYSRTWILGIPPTCHL